ncbi:MAG: hypothetical protein COU90_04440 [Candidatus Ryanbacteria bacterium CG10_big_fil_rev_8_21_14_0_10_43_42]|uniref:Uncharacterized protein n=1 Tax=Candidatus Ryanbacteria bacterium CG10_big_fil_rev_8_21_14_0_10_43_42 TaxID=1974864 RepID=A0A2M8KW12_9BACT|nr:MAG: hypothetical protein COU90_04440 [Candidatus Ryanbacteria bacterium CG10_big_fil_rev_8_21_14_0_10_43_42]
MNPKGIYDPLNEGGDKVMVEVVKRLIQEGDREEKELAKWNKKRPPYPGGTQLEILLQRGGLFGDVLTFTEDEEHDGEVKEVLGQEDWDRLVELRNRYINTSMTPQEWRISEQRRELYRILGKVVTVPQFQKYFSSEKYPEESGIVH